MGRQSRLGFVSVPLLRGGRVDQHPSFSPFLFIIYHLIPCLMLTLGIISNIWHQSDFSNVSFVDVICFGW